VLTEAGISTDVKLRHALNALFPIEVKAEEDENVKLVKPVQFEKALFPMVVTEAGIFTVPILEQL